MWASMLTYRANHRHQLHRTNHENFVKLRRTIENTTGLQYDAAGQIINLAKKDSQSKLSNC